MKTDADNFNEGRIVVPSANIVSSKPNELERIHGSEGWSVDNQHTDVRVYVMSEPRPLSPEQKHEIKRLSRQIQDVVDRRECGYSIEFTVKNDARPAKQYHAESMGWTDQLSDGEFTVMVDDVQAALHSVKDKYVRKAAERRKRERNANR